MLRHLLELQIEKKNVGNYFTILKLSIKVIDDSATTIKIYYQFSDDEYSKELVSRIIDFLLQYYNSVR